LGLDADVYVAPVTADEVMLCGLFSELSGVERVGIEDGFFALGGHSLLAMRLVRLIHERLDCEIHIATIFRNSTVAELAGIIDAFSKAEESFPQLIGGMGVIKDD